MTYHGYFVPWSIQITTGIVYMGIIVLLLSLQISMCSYVEAFMHDLKQQFQRFNEIEEKKSASPQPKPETMNIEMHTKHLLRNAIEFHNDMLK